MRKLLIITFLALGSALFAQNTKNLTEDVVNSIRDNYKQKSEADKGIRNALSNNDIRSLAVNRDVVGKADHQFKYKADVKGICDQKSSGRCWMFTGLSSLRPQIIKDKDLGGFEFSQNYLYFWDMFEKSNLFLEIILQNADKPLDDRTNEWALHNPIGDGGVWNSFANLVEKYGLVPNTVMPETYHSNNTSWLNQLLSRKLREDAMQLRDAKAQKLAPKKIDEMKFNMLCEVYRYLVLFLGEPPTEFKYRFEKEDAYKDYTPMSFFKEFFPNYKTSDYVMLMNDPSREYNKVYEIEFDRNVLEGKNWLYVNLPADELKKAALASLKDKEPLYSSCDVAKFLSKNDGTLDVNNFDFESLLGMKFGMDKATRIRTFDSGSSHAMLLVAVDVDDKDVPTKWQFENSWGSSYGHNGYLTFTDEWFNEYMFRIVVNKKYLSGDVQKMLDQKPIVLPPWDPMFAPEE